MNYELALELKEAGFPQVPQRNFYLERDEKGNEIVDKGITIPTLEELIEACGESFRSLFYFPNEELSDYRWTATSYIPKHAETGSSPINAVARLYLALNKK